MKSMKALASGIVDQIADDCHRDPQPDASSPRRAHETDELPAGTNRLRDPARVKGVVLGDNDYVYDATRFFRHFH
jgi:hypothetical protein